MIEILKETNHKAHTFYTYLWNAALNVHIDMCWDFFLVYKN